MLSVQSHSLGTFLFAQLCLVVSRTWCPARSVCFLDPKTRFSAQKSVFCHRTANFINGPFLALGKMVHIQPSDQLFDFLFPSYTRFRKKKTGQGAKKFSPTPLWVGAPSVSKSPRTLSGALDNKAGTS